MILAREQVAVAVHRDLQRGMASESLHRLRRHAGFNPSGYGEVSEPVPVETFRFEPIEQRQELPLDQIVMPNVPALAIWKDQVIGLREFRFHFPCLER